MADELSFVPDATRTDVTRQLRQLLKTTGYADSGIEEAIEPRTRVPLLPDDSVPATPLNTMLRLFHMSRSVNVDDAAQAFHPLSISQLVGARFLRQEGSQVTATVGIEPFCGLLVANPHLPDGENTLMPICLSTLEVAQFAIRRRFHKALDLGTGTGVQAMLAASHCDEVYALDINPNAVAAANFNCRWNGLHNVRCLEGDSFAPVADQRFDLIICNPPFVISPGMRLRFRDSGMAGDRFAFDLARRAPACLEEGGYFQMMFQWIETASEAWRDKLRSAFSGLGCDIWVLHTENESPEAYVTACLQANAEKSDGDASYAAWVSYLEELGTKAIGTGLITMQRQNGDRHHLWIDDAPSDRSRPYGSAIPQIFEARRYLEERTGSAFLDEKLLASTHLKMIQESRLEGPCWRAAASELQLCAGLRYSFDDVNQDLARIVASCDGKRTVRELISELAAGSGQNSSTHEKYLGQLHELAWYGFLEPASLASTLIEESNGQSEAAD